MVTSDQLADMIPLTATVLDGNPKKICMTRIELLALVNSIAPPVAAGSVDTVAYISALQATVTEQSKRAEKAEAELEMARVELRLANGLVEALRSDIAELK